MWNRVRAFIPWPGAFTTLAGGAKLRTAKIWRASVEEASAAAPGAVAQADKSGIVVACGGGGGLRIHELQLEGGRRLTAAEFLAGHPLHPGDRLG